MRVFGKIITRLLVKIGLKCSCGGWKRWKKHKLVIGIATLTSGQEVDIVVAGRPCIRCGFVQIPEQEVLLGVADLAVKHGEVVARM